LTAKVISARTAWQIIEIMKQMFDIQAEIIRQKDQLIVTIDVKRQYAERGKTAGEIKAYASEIIGLILTALLVAK
jgi:hypothetical protein